MPRNKSVKRDRNLQKKIKKYTDKGWSQKEAISFVNGDDIRGEKKIDWSKADWS